LVPEGRDAAGAIAEAEGVPPAEIKLKAPAFEEKEMA
jgi:hypothetical protein